MIYSIHDGFLNTYSDLKRYSSECDFQDIKNPVDGVTYPNICIDIPQSVKNEVVGNISKVMGRMVNIGVMFMRYSPKDVTVPHFAHHDLGEGKFSLMVYLNDAPNAGTTFLRHKATGACYAPENDKMVELLRRDQNKPDAWHKTIPVQMQQNRALIFDAGYFHCAEPYGGFGESQNDGRIVLTAFFS